MKTYSPSSYQNAIKNAFKAVRTGNRKEAIRWTNLAVAQNPKEEDPWLLMAYLASPDQSIEYLQHVLKLNPLSKRAKKGMVWALNRLNQDESKKTRKFPESELLEITQKMAARAASRQPKNISKIKQDKSTGLFPQEQKIIGGFFVFLSIIFISFMVWLTSPDIVQGSFQNSNNSHEPALVLKASQTSTNTATPINTPTNTATATPTDTPTNTATPTSTPTFTPTFTSTPAPTNTARPKPPYALDQNWIEVDLSAQTLTRFQLAHGKLPLL